ncbi:MAG: ABC transporter permease [Oscillospiraceae bacterium]|jgi:ribose/xylose/arabinose/galactoside ABC-type transport system permease subunit|nr:ABC transporter permease [Oscillospiraceae bacterium]MCI1990764.1 ABC transporter permease [Oscillospiraceae bacterium]
MRTNLKSREQFSKLSYGVYLLLVITLIAFLIASGSQGSAKGVLNVIRQAAPLGIVAIGQTLILLMGGIDLSVGSVMTLVNIVASSIMAGRNDNIGAAVVVCLLLSAMIGLINGLIIAKFQMPPFLITMAMGSIIEGIYFVYSKGSPNGSIASRFRVISDGWIGGTFPIAILVWLAFWGLVSFILYKTPYGKRYYFTGGNRRAAYLSGIHTFSLTVSAYVLCSLMAGIAGLMISAFIGVASMSVGTDYTLNSIAATVIGGTSFNGGIGTLEGTFPGVLIMAFLQSILTMLNISQAGKNISQGLIIIIMVAMNHYKQK